MKLELGFQVLEKINVHSIVLKISPPSEMF